MRALTSEKEQQEAQNKELMQEVGKKKRTFEEYEAQQAKHLDTILELETNYDSSLNSMAELEIKHHKLQRMHDDSLAISREKMNLLEAALVEEQLVQANMKIQLISVGDELEEKKSELAALKQAKKNQDIQLDQMTKLQNAKEFLLDLVEKLHLDIQQLNQTAEQLRQNLVDKESDIVVLKKTIEEQKRGLQLINQAVDQAILQIRPFE